MAPLRIDEQVGRVLDGRYRLSRLLGTGASAHVYVADDVRLRRRVAVKVLHPTLAGDQAFLRRFRAEAQVVGALRHPNIGRVYDWGEDGGSPFLVMELLEGGSLRSLLDTGFLFSPAQVLRLGIEAAGALDHAHRRGLVHRDIKPANLIFDEDSRVSVADFGLARALAESTWTEPAGAVVGTARYAAPEQVRGHALDARADIYALALVMVEAVTGRVPFATDTTLATLMARVDKPLDVGADLGPLTRVLEASGTVDPADRLDAAGLMRELQRLADRIPPPAALPLVGTTRAASPERDDEPTEIPGGRSVPFDIDVVDRHPGAAGAASYLGAANAAGAEAAAPAGNAPAQAPSPGSGPEDGWGGDRPAGGRGRAGEVTAVKPRRRRKRVVAIVVAVVVVLAAAGVGVFLLTRPTPTHPVPTLKGDTEAEALQILRPLHFGLRVGTRSYNPTVPRGQVIHQTPSTGKLHQGDRVTVTLSAGPRPIAVPSLANQTQANATTALTTAGLKVGQVSHAASTTVTEGKVISTTPSSGTLLPGQSVALVVSSGLPTTPVPSLTGATAASYSGAQAALTAVGLLSTENIEYSDTVPAGAVIATDPGPGFAAPLGSTIVVDVSKGPDLVAVPPVTNDSVAAATAALSADGFSVSGVTGNPTAAVSGTVPAAGTQAHVGSAVQIATG